MEHITLSEQLLPSKMVCLSKFLSWTSGFMNCLYQKWSRSSGWGSYSLYNLLIVDGHSSFGSWCFMLSPWWIVEIANPKAMDNPTCYVISVKHVNNVICNLLLSVVHGHCNFGSWWCLFRFFDKIVNPKAMAKLVRHIIYVKNISDEMCGVLSNSLPWTTFLHLSCICH